MHGDGVEPSNPKERIYSPPRLATSLPVLIFVSATCMVLEVYQNPRKGQTPHALNCSMSRDTNRPIGFTLGLPVSLQSTRFKDRQGFEPWDDFRRLWFSRPVLSTTQPSIHIPNRCASATTCRKVGLCFLTSPLGRLCCAVIARVGLEPTTFGL